MTSSESHETDRSDPWYQSTPAVITALLIAPPLGLYLMWDDLHGRAPTRWAVTVVAAVWLLSCIGNMRDYLVYDLFLIAVTIATILWARQRGPRAERVEIHQQVVRRNEVLRQERAARVLEAQRKFLAGQTVLVKEYRTQAEYQRDATVLHADGWRVTSAMNQQPRAGCLRILTLGIFALVFHPKAVIVVTYQREQRDN